MSLSSQSAGVTILKNKFTTEEERHWLKRVHLNSNNIGFRFRLQTRKLEGLLRSFLFMEMKR